MANPSTNQSSSEQPEKKRFGLVNAVALACVIGGWAAVVILYGLAVHFGINGQEERAGVCALIFFPVWCVLGIATVASLLIMYRRKQMGLLAIPLISIWGYAIVSYNMVLQWIKMQS